jgi:hypothetical protein
MAKTERIKDKSPQTKARSTISIPASHIEEICLKLLMLVVVMPIPMKTTTDNNAFSLDIPSNITSCLVVMIAMVFLFERKKVNLARNNT